MGDRDLRTMFDDAFGPEPPPPLIDPTVRAGRAALRRRRILVSTGAAGCVAVIALGATQVGGSPTAQPDQLHRPTPTESATGEAALTRATRIDESWRQDCGHSGQKPCDEYAAGAAPVGIDVQGDLVRASKDVVIIKKAVDPTPAAGGHTIEVELRTPDSTLACWYVLTRRADGTLKVRIADPSRSAIDFVTWADAINRSEHVDGAPPLSGVRKLLGNSG